MRHSLHFIHYFLILLLISKAAFAQDNAELVSVSDGEMPSSAERSLENDSLPAKDSEGLQKDEGISADSRIRQVGEKSEKSASDADARWFSVPSMDLWFDWIFKKADRGWLISYFAKNGWGVPKDCFALIAPIRIQDGHLQMQYFSYGDTAFEYSMTMSGEERFWPASTVKLIASVMALIKLNAYGLSHKARLLFNDQEGHFEGTAEELCREAIIPSNNTAYNRLMEIAGFDEINDHYLPDVFGYPTMTLQRRYVRHKPEDNIRTSPVIVYEEGDKIGQIESRVSSGRMRSLCPRESNCTTLAELAETVFRVVFHDNLPADYRFPVYNDDVKMLNQVLLEAPSCIGKGVAEVLGNDALVYNKGGKVIGDDRLEVGVVSSADGNEKYLIALSMPYYEGVENETNLLAKRMILAMRALESEE